MTAIIKGKTEPTIITTQITVDPFGFVDPIDLSVVDCITGATCDLSDTNLTIGEYGSGSTLTITFPANPFTPSAGYDVKIEGTGGVPTPQIREVTIPVSVNRVGPQWIEE